MVGRPVCENPKPASKISCDQHAPAEQQRRAAIGHGAGSSAALLQPPSAGLNSSRECEYVRGMSLQLISQNNRGSGTISCSNKRQSTPDKKKRPPSRRP